MFIVQIADHYLAQGGLCATALRWYSQTGGSLNDGDQVVVGDILRQSHLSLVRDPDLVPAMYFVGGDSPAAKVFGDHWASSAPGSPGIPDNDAERACNSAYFDAHYFDNPQLHLCNADFRNANGAITNLLYSRVLIPIRVNSKSRLVLCCADIIRSNN